MHVHAGSVLTLQLFEGSFRVRTHRKCRRADVRLRAARCEALDLADCHATASDFTSDGEARLGVGYRQEGTRVSRSDATFLEQLLDRLFELEQADGIGAGCALFARAFGALFLCEVKFVY